jgi:hypothetical protein
LSHWWILLFFFSDKGDVFVAYNYCKSCPCMSSDFTGF